MLTLIRACVALGFAILGLIVGPVVAFTVGPGWGIGAWLMLQCLASLIIPEFDN